jgi:hypothetical protein
MLCLRRFSVASFLAAGACLTGCGAGDVELGANDPRAHGAADAGGQVLSGDAGDAGAVTSFCAGSGPAVPLPIFGDCTGDLAKKTFRFAVCACTNLNFGGALVTDAKSSATGAVSSTAASVGVNGTYNGMSVASTLGGSLWTNGGNLVVDGTSRVHADAYVQGGTQGALTVDGVLHVPAGQPHAGVSAAGGTVTQAVQVAAPCDCSSPLDIAAIVRGFAQQNDDAAAGLDPATVAHVTADRTLTLGCGRYYLASVGGSAPLTLRITGRAALAVGGSILHDTTPLTVAVDPGAELDLFVGGDVLLSGVTVIGDQGRGAATRLYVAGTFGYDGRLALAANLYLPNAAFTTTTTGTEVWGSILAKNVGVTGNLTVHYDPSILDVTGCAPPAKACGSCHDCANPSPACKNGACGACDVDGDCCPPLHCRAGACIADIR